MVRALRAQHVRAPHRQRPVRGRDDRRRRRGVRRRARRPVGLPARLRGAAAARAHRPRPLLPDLRVVTIHLSILLFAPVALGLLGGLLPGRVALYLAFAGTLVSLVLAVVMLFDFDHTRDGLQYVTDDQW